MSRSLDQNVFGWIESEVKPAVNRRIYTGLPEHEGVESLPELINGGKRLRPALTMLVGRSCGVDEETLVDIAAGIELLHTCSLVHDDIIDGDRFRRGSEAAWVRFGEESAITFGDILLVQGIQLLPNACRDLALDKCVKMGIGQQMDLEFENRCDPTVEEYMEMTRYKTGALLELCLEAPQVVAGVDWPIERYASLGPAFQIRDDLLDFEDGKGRSQIGNDVRAGKRTLMVVYADDKRIYDILNKPFEETSAEDVERVYEWLQDYESLAFANDRMQRLVDEAIHAIEPLPESWEKQGLHELCQYLIERTH